MTLTPPLFEIINVNYRYDGVVPALNGLTLEIAAGQRVALLGANGSGKSTLLRILDGLLFPDSGTVRYAGEPLTAARLQEEHVRFDFRRRVGLVFQNPDIQLFNPTVFDEVAFGPLQLRWPRNEIAERVEQALDTMGIHHLKGRAPYHLSGGEKKRVALAAVLVLQPSVLLLDEPTAGLDPKSQSQIIDLLYGQDSIQTVIAATHDLTIVEHIASQCHILEGGRAVASGTPEQILADTALLQRTSLIHAHRHAHGDIVHSHPHIHGHEPHEH